MDLRKLIESMDLIETRPTVKQPVAVDVRSTVRPKKQYGENSIAAQLLIALGHSELLDEAETATPDPATADRVKKMAKKYYDRSLPSGANAIDPETGMIYYNDPSAKDTQPYNPKPMAFNFMDKPDQKQLASDLAQAGLQVINKDGGAYVDPNQLANIVNPPAPEPAPEPAPAPAPESGPESGPAPAGGQATANSDPRFTYAGQETGQYDPKVHGALTAPVQQVHDYAEERQQMKTLLDKIEADLKKPAPPKPIPSATQQGNTKYPQNVDAMGNVMQEDDKAIDLIRKIGK